MPFNEEKLDTIKYMMSHPLHPHRPAPKEEKVEHPRDEEVVEEHPKKPLGKRIAHLLFHTPTDAELGLPPGSAAHMSKKEIFETIDYAVHHPSHPQRPDPVHPAAPKRQESDHVWDEKHLSKKDAMHEIEHAWKHPFHPSHA